MTELVQLTRETKFSQCPPCENSSLNHPTNKTDGDKLDRRSQRCCFPSRRVVVVVKSLIQNKHLLSSTGPPKHIVRTFPLRSPCLSVASVASSSLPASEPTEKTTVRLVLVAGSFRGNTCIHRSRSPKIFSAFYALDRDTFLVVAFVNKNHNSESPL